MIETMRILFIVQNYPPEPGPVRYTRDLAVALAARGHDVTVITGLPHYPTGEPTSGFGRTRPQRRREEGVHVIRVPLIMASNQQPVRRVLGWLTFSMSAWAWVLLERRPDVIVASVPPFPVAALGLVSARLRRVPVVMMLRDVEPLCSLHIRGLEGHSLARPMIQTAMAVYRRADHIVVLHENQRQSLLDYRPMPATETITHGIDVAGFLRQAAQPDRLALPRRDGRRLAVYLGTIGAAHGIPSLVAAFGTPAVRSLSIDLAVVGDGEESAICRQWVEQQDLTNVSLVPAIPLEQVPAVLGQADLLVCAYRTRDRTLAGIIGSKFYEYLAAGKPLLVNGTGVAADLVQQVGNGWTCNSDDPATLAGALSAFLADPEQAAAMGLRGQRYARDHFSARDRHDRWEDLLEGLAQGHVGGRARTGRGALPPCR